MPIPGKAEARPLPGQQQQVHQHRSANFLSAIPIKKRRFPIIRPQSPPEDENIPEPQIPDEEKSKKSEESLSDPKTVACSPVNDASKTSAWVVTKDDDTPSNIESGQATVETIASGHWEKKPTASLNPVSDFGNETTNVETIASGHEEAKITVSLNPVSDFRNKTTDVETIASGPQEAKPTVSLNPVSDFRNKTTDVETIAPGHQEVKPTVSLSDVSDFRNKTTGVERIASRPHEAKPTASFDPVSDFRNKTTDVEKIASGPQEAKPTASFDPVSDFRNKMTDVETIACVPQEVKPTASLDHVSDLTIKTDDISLKKNISSDPEVLESCTAPQTSIVNQEIACGSGLSMAPMSVELSLGLKEPLVSSSLEHKQSVAICFTPEKSDASQLRLALSEENPVGFENNNPTTVGDVGTNRSNWDLNTTMDDWEEGSSKNDSVIAHNFAHIGGCVKTDSCHDEKSSLTTAESVDLGLNKGKKLISDVDKSRPSNTTIHIGPQCKIDDSLGLKLSMPHREHLSSFGSFVSTSATLNLGLQRVNMSAINMNRAVKLEPIDESSRRDCSVGSSNSSSSTHNMVLLRSGSVKTESFNNRILETVLRSPVSPHKLVNHSMSINPETHQESCASSSLTVPLMPQNYLELSIHSKDLQLRPCEIDNEHKLTRVDEAVTDDAEKINMLAEVNEELFESDCRSQGIRAVDNSVGIGENIRGKENADLEEGEVWEPVQHPAIEEGPFDMEKKTNHLEFSRCGFKNSQGSGNLEYDGKYSIKENHDTSNSNKDSVSISCKPNSEKNNNNHLQKVLDTVVEEVDEKIFVSVAPDKRLDLSRRENIEETPVKEISSDRPTNVNSGFDVEVAAITDDNKVVQELCLGESISTLDNMVAASLSGHDAAKDSGNKSRIINLSRASVVTSPCKTRSIPNRWMIQRSGKERFSDPDGEIQPRGNREENYGGDGGSNKFTKDRVNDQSLRNSRPNFMHGRGRMPGRFGSLRSNEWDSDHDFASDTSYGTPNYRPFRRKHAPDVEIECKGYDIQPDCNNNRRKTTNDEFRHAPMRKLSSGGNRDGPVNRGINQTFRRFPRNRSPNGDKFMRHLSDDIMNPVYNHPQAMYDEFDGQVDRGNRNFSNMQRKGYPRVRSKSPIRSRTRSPGPWSSPRRRSPNGIQDLPQHRSPGFYRTGKMRSPDRGCFRDEMVSRSRGSSYVARHPNNDVRDTDPGREHSHPRLLVNPNRRGSPARVFQRNSRRADTLDSREMEDGDEYMSNEPLQSNKFHDERRKFTERRGPGPGPGRSFRPGYNCGDGENFRFEMNDDGSRPYRFCPDTDSDFVERGESTRERECDGRIKHQPMGTSRRNRNDEDQQDGEYMPVERVWRDDGFGDGRGKRRRF